MLRTLQEYMDIEEQFIFCAVHCNIITQYKPKKCTFPKLIF